MKILYLPNEYSQQRQHEKKRNIYPVLLAMEATYMRNEGHTVLWDRPEDKNNVQKIISEPQGIPFLKLPNPDRIFTRAFDEKWQGNGNFKYHLGTYIQAANGCWHGKCSFCVENGKPYAVRPVDDVIDELCELRRMGFQEVFDDSGTFPVGDWLHNFCERHKWIKSQKPFYLGCNMRMVDVDYRLMKEAGFRMLLFGVESSNQFTLDKINKGVQTEDVFYIIKAAKAGLEPHVAVMFGYPWETDEQAVRTLKLVHWLLRKGYAKTAQASFYTTPKGDCNLEHRKYINKIYNVWHYPDFWFNKLRDIKNTADLKYFWRSIKEGLNAKR
jgi:radical SAM superfamily enzyme YgiQ (UPF0313 family)